MDILEIEKICLAISRIEESYLDLCLDGVYELIHVNLHDLFALFNSKSNDRTCLVFYDTGQGRSFGLEQKLS